MKANQLRHTVAHTESEAPESAAEAVDVRVSLSLEGTHTRTEPETQLVLRTPVVGGNGGLLPGDVDAEKFNELLVAERTRRAVKRVLDQEERPLTPMPAPCSLKQRFETPRPAIQYRIQDWFVVGGHVILVAQYKSGKTTTLGNFVRSVIDGDPFFGVAEVQPVKSIVMLDFEMSPGQIEGWLRDQNIQNTDRVHLVTLRGAASSFDILNPSRRREWARQLRALKPDIVTVDCLRPAMDALGLNEHTDAGIWLTAFDELLKDAGIPEALIVHHSGHSGDRSRGDSRILDWPDGIWNLVRENRDDLNSTRFITAKGRDISVDEGQLTFDSVTRHLTYAPKDRKRAGADKVLRDVVREVANATEPPSIRDVKAVLRGRYSAGAIEAALKTACNPTRAYLARVKGRKGSWLHSIAAPGRLLLADGAADADQIEGVQ